MFCRFGRVWIYSSFFSYKLCVSGVDVVCYVSLISRFQPMCHKNIIDGVFPLF